MEIVIVGDASAGATLVADAIQSLLHRQPTAVLGLATGDSPRPIYDELVERYRTGRLSFGAARCFQLDEYIGLPSDHPASYRAVLERDLSGRMDLSPGALRRLNGWADDLQTACEEYEQAIRDSGGIDLQLLGIGSNGHIGFNEPLSSLGSRTRVKMLTDQTRRDNARFFGDDLAAVPLHVVTQGIGTILEARHLILVAWGTAKAGAIARCVEGPLTATFPASALQLHPHATVVVDEDAASGLTWRDYVKASFENKPKWQAL